MASTGAKGKSTGGKPKPKGGRVTPKGGPAAAQAARARSAGLSPSTESSRYTPPIPKARRHSPPWLPVLLFALLGLGMLTIILNYAGVLPGGQSAWYLLPGLAFITCGILTATYWH